MFEGQLPRYGKKIRGSEPREQVRTARRGSRNPQGRTLFSMTGSWFYLLDFLRSKLTPVHFYRSRLSVSQDICRSVVPSLSKAVQCFAKPCSVSKKANTNTFRNLRCAPRRRRVGALHRIAPAAAERRSFVCLRKRNGCMQHEHLPNLSPGPCLFFVSSVFIRQLLSEGVVEKNCKQLVQNTQFS